MKLTWLGHSAYRLAFGDNVILIDPFLAGNPGFKGQDAEAAAAGCTHIILTHGHADHVGDTVAIHKKTGATVLGNFDLLMWLANQGVDKMDPGNTGGTVTHNGFTVTWTQAHHSSGQIDDNGVSAYLGNPNGVVIHIDGEKTLYHMGDTDIFGDMALIQELHRPDIGIVPIGDRFTMGGAVAALACRRYFTFETIIPSHYGSFPIIDQTADKLLEAMQDDKDRVLVMEVGKTVEL